MSPYSAVSGHPQLAIKRPWTSEPAKKEPMMTNDSSAAEPSAESDAATGFANVGERVKDALERTSQITENLRAFHSGGVEALLETSRRASKGADTIRIGAADYASRSIDASLAAVKAFSKAKNPGELLSLQSEYIRSSLNSALGELSRVADLWFKLASEVAEPMSTEARRVSEQVASAVDHKNETK